MACAICINHCSFLLPPIPSMGTTVSVSGEINERLVNDVVLSLKIAALHKPRVIRININSGGGSVLEGHKIITKIQELQGKGIKFTCHATMAASMAFTILQYCDNRLADENSILMQHMIHNGKGRENIVLPTIEAQTTIAFLDRLHGADEAKRLGMTFMEYISKYQYSKWYKGSEACDDNVVDIVYDHKNNKVTSCQ